MNKVMQVRVLLPELPLSDEEERIYIEKVMNDISNQVKGMINAERQAETMRYWQAKLLKWQIEDYNLEERYKALNEQHRINESNGNLGP